MKYAAIIIAGLLMTGCGDDRAAMVKTLMDKCPGEVTFTYTITPARVTDSAIVTCKATREERTSNGKRD